jgi:hypothetical protein
LAVSYEIVTHDRTGRERVHPYTGEDALAPGSVVLIGGRYWLVDRVEQARVQTQPARYRLTLRHPGGRQESGAFRRFRADAPAPGRQLTTLADGAPISWVVVEQRLAYDAAGEPFLESIAERDYTEGESLPNHQLEHALDQETSDAGATAAALMRAEAAGLAIELVGLEAGEVADWDKRGPTFPRSFSRRSRTTCSISAVSMRTAIRRRHGWTRLSSALATISPASAPALKIATARSRSGSSRRQDLRCHRPRRRRFEPVQGLRLDVSAGRCRRPPSWRFQARP